MNIHTTMIALRLSMGFILLWAFIDKLFGLGFSTTAENAWLNGGSPTYGFLTFGTKGPFAEWFQTLAGIAAIDWIFMIGLLCVGIGLIINRFVVWSAIGGSLMLLLMYLAVLPPSNNPVIDSHIVYILILILLAQTYKEKRRR